MISRIQRARDIARQVLERGPRMTPKEMNDLIRRTNIMDVTIPSPRPGGLVAASKAMTGTDKLMFGAAGLTGGAFALSQTDPNDLGKQIARMNMTLQEGLNTVRQKATDLAQIPQIYFMQVEQGYKDEMQRQQEMQNIQEFGNPMGAPEELEPTMEEQAIQPVSLLFAEGGPADSGRTMSDLDMLKNRNIAAALGESGRTLSNKDKMMMRDMLGRTMSDNEPRFETRSRENQMFSIDANINNLMKSYNMLVDAKEFGRAQEVADQIDQLQQQKIAIQAQNVPFMMESGPLTDLSNKIGPMMGTLGAMGESGRTISNRGRQIVENILQDISL
jgi:hypothetical protein